ncbi:MAG: BON domain-containing protein [Chloroflexota bacterium]
MWGPGDPLYPQTDQEVMDAVRTAYFLDPDLPENAFEVLSIDRVVYLRGVVPTTDLKRRAENVAGQVTGVNRVVNELRVAIP